MRVMVVRTCEVGLRLFFRVGCFRLAEGDAFSTVDYHFEFVALIEDDVHQFRHVGHVDAAVAVDVGFPDDEPIILIAEDIVYEEGYVGHVDGTVAVHITHAGGQLEVCAEGVDGSVGFGMAERVAIVEVEHAHVLAGEGHRVVGTHPCCSRRCRLRCGGQPWHRCCRRG